MHHCLYISELLHLIFECVGRAEDDPSYRDAHVGRKTLASLARTCHLFSSPALDVLWHDLYGFEPLLKIFPMATSLVDDTRWSTFRKYAKRVKSIHGREARVPVRIKQEFFSSIQYCPKLYLPLLPNVTELEWSELSFSALDDSAMSLLRYFAGPAVTKIKISLVRWLAHSPAELDVLTDLPRLCPNVTSFTLILGFSWDYEPCVEVGRMVTEWPRLRTLRTCALAQPMMDQLLTRKTVETLSLAFHNASPKYTGKIPDMVREISLGVDGPSLCVYHLSNLWASPTRFRLLIGMNEEQKEADIEHMFHLLPRRLDASRLRALTIQPASSIIGIPLWHTLQLHPPIVSALAAFTALHELDLDCLCTAQIGDADYARMAASLRQLRRLTLGTTNPSILRPWPAASVGAVIAVLTHCPDLETLHIVFDGSIPPPGGAILKEGQVTLPAVRVSEGWGVCHRRVTRFGVGYSPIGDATVCVMAACFKSIMPCVVQIEHRDRDKQWNTVQRLLASG